MPDIIETVEVEQVHDSDKYHIKRIIKEELTKETMTHICAQMIMGRKNLQIQANDLPKQLKAREEYLGKEIGALNARMEPFEAFMKKYQVEIDKIVKEEEEKNRKIAEAQKQ